MKKIVLSLLAVSMSLSVLAGCGGEETSSAASTSSASSAASSGEGDNTFVVGLDDAFPPMGFRDENNEIVGFDIDMAREVSDRLGLELVLQPIDWNSKEMELAGGKVDCLWNGLTITPEREESMAMSEPYLANSQVIVVREDSGITDKAGVAGKTVGVQTGSSAEEAIAKDEISGTIGELVQIADNVSALSDLKIGRLDAVVLDEVVASYYIAQEGNEGLVILPEKLAAEEYGVAFAKDNTALRDQVQEVLDEMIADGTAAEISTKWFGEDKVLRADASSETAGVSDAAGASDTAGVSEVSGASDAAVETAGASEEAAA